LSAPVTVFIEADYCVKRYICGFKIPNEVYMMCFCLSVFWFGICAQCFCKMWVYDICSGTTRIIFCLAIPRWLESVLWPVLS